LNDVNNGMCSNLFTSKMNSVFIPSKPIALFFCSFLNVQSSLVNVISMFKVWLGGGFVT
jgi:hypothetical protein